MTRTPADAPMNFLRAIFSPGGLGECLLNADDVLAELGPRFAFAARAPRRGAAGCTRKPC